MILLDASGLFAFLNERDPIRERVASVMDGEPDAGVLSPFVLAELDYLVSTRVGVGAPLDLLADIAAGAYSLAPFGPPDVDDARGIVERYRDQRIGLADASIVLLAGRYRTDRVLTLDERHFRVLRTPAGEPFRILPADA